jgi:cupin fold WbuC family metalloprotein
MIEIHHRLLNEISAKAQQAPRQRMNYNFHKEMSDPLHRMLNALEPGTYVRPHKHENPDKMESFIILQGKILVVIFSEEGDISNYCILEHQSGNYGVEIPPRIFHSIIALAPGSVVYEVKNGPYSPADDKNFAPWAPEEGSPEAKKYLSSLLQKIDLRPE